MDHVSPITRRPTLLTLTIPPRRDPVARLALLFLVGVVCAAMYFTATSAVQATAQAEEQRIFIEPTPTLPTAAPGEAPAFALAQPTPTAQSWIDQRLTAVAGAADNFANAQAAQLAAEQAEAQRLAAEQAAAIEAQRQAAERAQYLANVGAQAPHSPRGDVAHPSTPDVQELPSGALIVTEPAPSVVDPNAQAVAVPALSQEQAAVIGARESNGCAAGQVFYPRSGCHTPGSGGAMPGAVSP